MLFGVMVPWSSGIMVQATQTYSPVQVCVHWPWIVGLKGHAPLFNVSFVKSD